MTDSRDEHETYGHTESPIIARLQEQIARLTAERDEARRQICRIECANDTDWMSGPFPMRTSTPMMFAELHGWDCFDKEMME